MQLTNSDLVLAQRYPFSAYAKAVVKKSDSVLDNIDGAVLQRAQFMLQRAFGGKPYEQYSDTDDHTMTNEILAFPVAKILVRLINRLELTRKFAVMWGALILSKLDELKEVRQIFRIAEELGIEYEDTGNGIAVPISHYLRPDLEKPADKLANQKVNGGFVYLDINHFKILIAMIAAQELKTSIESIGLQMKDAPQNLKRAAEDLDKEFMQTTRAQFSKSDFGAVAPEAFPPCMAKIYSELLSGVNVTHSGRFAIAAFLASIGMPAEKIIDAFRRTPNFSESVTRYQVERIAGVKGAAYSSPSCDKMRSYNLCVANCPVSHPVQFYELEISRGKSPAAAAKI